MKPFILAFSASLLPLSLALATPTEAWAQDAPGKDPAGHKATSGADGPSDSSAGADPSAASPTKEGAAPPSGDGATAPKVDPKVDPKATKFYLGARFRNFVVPSFMFNVFVDGGPGAVNVFSGGPELMVQMGALETVVSLTVPYADFSMSEFVFKSSADPDEAYEIVSSSLKLITASVDLLGRVKLTKTGSVALLIGGGVGISGVIGDIRRTQAYPDDPNNPDPDQPSKWHKCDAPGSPDVVAPDGNRYCGADNDHYPDGGEDFSEPYWQDGGSKPVIFPYVALPHLALEVTPIDQFMVRVDTGFSITGFFFGLAAGGKLPI